jgi:uncharacterized protein (DUF924 family)
MARQALEAGMQKMSGDVHEWDRVLEFWFPEGANLEVDTELHRQYWAWRMRGGADAEIIDRFAEVTEQAAAGELDHWAADSHGRLALVIALDQFPRSLWRDTPRAFAQDEKALAVALEGHGNGQYEALETPWYRTVYNLPLGHCEGPDHLARLDKGEALAIAILAMAPGHLCQTYEFALSQCEEVRKVILAYGRHPHRNAALGRESTPEEAIYIATGKFPHLRKPGEDS